MVRSSIILFAVFCCAGLSAAKFDPVDSPADKNILELEKYFKSSVFPEIVTNDHGGAFATHYKVLSKKTDEPWVNSMKQLIYIERAKWGVYSMPDDVEAKEIKKNNKRYKQIASAFIFDHMNEYKERREAFIETIKEKLSKSGYTLIVGSDGNSFGSCSWMAVLRKSKKDVSLFQACYSE
jgi:hypothetical protein